MCGRYRLSRHKQMLTEHFGVEIDDNWQPRYNIAPTQLVPVIIRSDHEQPARTYEKMRWGLIPSWTKDAGSIRRGGIINARADSVTAKPSFRELFRKRRCLIPADGFYEWKREIRGKVPFCFAMADDALFAFAGIWDRWLDAAGQAVDTCSIITTTANPLCAEIHDRMPVILPEHAYSTWLDPAFQDTDSLIQLLRPFDAAHMRRYEVSGRVNSPSNDDAAYSEPV
jgi:putative SOS response-associated peptidase YedK